jgi:hypothetical protein
MESVRQFLYQAATLAMMAMLQAAIAFQDDANGGDFLYGGYRYIDRYGY